MRQSFFSRFRRSTLAVGTGVLVVAGAFAALPARAEVPVGDDAPDVKAEAYLNTEPVTLAKLKGRLILLELFTTT